MTSPLLTKAFVSLFVQNFFILTAINVLNVLPDHFATIGASKTYIGLYMNITSLVMVALAIPLSDHADRFGRKRLIMWGYATALIAFAGSFLLSEHLVILVFLRAISGFIFCLAFTVQTAEMFGLLPRSRRFSGMAIYGISGLVANPFGSFIGELINGSIGARWLFIAAFAFTVLGFIPAISHRFHERAAEDPKSEYFIDLVKRKELRPLFAFSFLLGSAYAVFATFLVNLTRERLGIPTISSFFASFSAVAIFIRLFLGKHLERISPRTIIAVCFPLEATAFALCFVLRSAAMLPVIGVIYGIGHSIMWPLVSSLFVNSGTDTDRLGLNNLYSSINQAGGIAAAVIMGAIADAAGLPVIFFIMAVLSLAMVPLSLIGLRRTEVHS